MHVVLLLERLVPVPIAHAFAHRIRAVEELHEAHAAFDEPPRQHAVAREAGLEFVRIVHAVGFERGLAFLAQITGLRRAQLHPGREFVTRDARAQIAVPGMTRKMTLVQQLEKIARAGFGSGRNFPGRFQIRNRFVGREGGALKHRGQEGRVPMVRPHLGHAARIGNGHERGQVLLLAAQGIRRPRAHAGKTIQGETGAHLIFRRAMRVRFRGHRMDEAQVVREIGKTRQHV